MSADPPAMSPANSSVLSDLSRSASPVLDKPHSPSIPRSPTDLPNPSADQQMSAAAAPTPPPLARRESHDSDLSGNSDGSSSLTNLSDDQADADADADAAEDNENESENDGASDTKDAPSPGPSAKASIRRSSIIPDEPWGWAKKSQIQSKSKASSDDQDEDEEQELESEDAAGSESSDRPDGKEDDDPETSIESTVRNQRARANSTATRPRANSLANDMLKLKADDGSGSTNTPTKSPSLSPVSDLESFTGKPEEKVDEVVDGTVDEEMEHGEQEVVAPVVVLEAFDRMEGMETLTALEVALAMTREYLYTSKMQQYSMEEEALNAGTHRELLHQYDELDRRKAARLEFTEKRYKTAVACIKRKRLEDTDLVMNTWRYERDELQRKMADAYISEKRALEREKANLDRYSSPRPITPPMPTEFAEEPPKKRVKVEKLICSVTAKNVRRNIESALTYPNVDGVSADDLEADLIAMGLRGKPPSETGLGLVAPMQNGHRELLPAMSQQQGEYHQGIAPPMHHQQFQHQAPLHLHHIHGPFPHGHQSHPPHLPPQQQPQVVQHHPPGPTFSSWAPESQMPFSTHQHHHHNHVQHSHQPSHMQPLPGLPQHMQIQGAPQPPAMSPNQHRMGYMPSQPTTHTVLQSAERPPSSHMHMSSSAQPFNMGGPPPPTLTTWNEIRKDRDPNTTSPSSHRHARRPSPIPSHQQSHTHRDQVMFPPQLPQQQAPPSMHTHGPPQGPSPSHISSRSAQPPPLEQRRSGERSSKSSSKRKAEDEPDMRREAKRPELNGPLGSSQHIRSTNVSPQDQRGQQGRSLPAFSAGPPHHNNTANILKERVPPWEQQPNNPSQGNNQNQSRHGMQGSAGQPGLSHSSLQGSSQNRQHAPSSQMFNDFSRPQAHKSSTLPNAMFPSHAQSQSQSMHRPPSMMGTSHGRPPSPPPAMRKPTITPPHVQQHNSYMSSGGASQGPRSPDKMPYGPPLPPQTQPGSGTQTPTSAGGNGHIRSSGESHRNNIPNGPPNMGPRPYAMPKSSSVPTSMSTMGPPINSSTPVSDSSKTERPSAGPSGAAGPVPPPVPVPIPPPTQLPPVQKYGHGLASRLFPSSGLGGSPSGGRSASG